MPEWVAPHWVRGAFTQLVPAAQPWVFDWPMRKPALGKLAKPRAPALTKSYEKLCQHNTDRTSSAPRTRDWSPESPDPARNNNGISRRSSSFHHHGPPAGHWRGSPEVRDQEEPRDRGASYPNPPPAPRTRAWWTGRAFTGHIQDPATAGMNS